jgi:hypothetical protein
MCAYLSPEPVVPPLPTRTAPASHIWVTLGGQRLFPTILFFDLTFGELRSWKALLLEHVKPDPFDGHLVTNQLLQR